VHRLVPSLEVARTSRGKKAKVHALADALRAVARDGDDDELATAARLVAGSVLPGRDGSVLGVGFALVLSAVCTAYGIAPAELQSCARSLGDLGDAVAQLAAQTPGAALRPGLPLAALARALAATSDRTTKAKRLEDAYTACRPDQAKHLTKVLLGELRVGVREGTLEEAIAVAFERDVKEVREAGLLVTDPGELVLLARHDELASATFSTGSQVAFMLASPIETVKAPMRPLEHVWEDKLDGVRVQLHAKPGLVKVFARGGGDVSAVFPEVTAAFARVARDVVLDGEILAVGDDLRPRPFQALQARLNRKSPDAALLASTPVALFAFDILGDGEPLLSLPWAARRERLLAFFAHDRLAPWAQPTVAHPFDDSAPLEAQIDAAYAGARGRGHEGIVIKDTTSRYEAGRRGSAWRKVKRALATLDVVITRAERGHGRRAHVLSDYTFAVWNGDATALVEIGKAYSGLTDVEIAQLTDELSARTREEKGGQRFVEPSVVLEIAFDGLQPSKRHASGFALRFPRIVRIRADKKPEDADTFATVEGIFAGQLGSGHREEVAAAPRPAKNARSRGSKAAPGQLDLFAEVRK
jgi:DNA ligase-1